MNGEFTGTVDRIVDGETAVILLEEDGEVIEQVDVPVERLPDPAREDGGVLSVTMADGEFVEASYLEAETTERRESIREKLDRLSRPLSEDDS